jgi:hypothetical protein
MAILVGRFKRKKERSDVPLIKKHDRELAKMQTKTRERHPSSRSPRQLAQEQNYK